MNGATEPTLVERSVLERGQRPFVTQQCKSSINNNTTTSTTVEQLHNCKNKCDCGYYWEKVTIPWYQSHIVSNCKRNKAKGALNIKSKFVWVLNSCVWANTVLRKCTQITQIEQPSQAQPSLTRAEQTLTSEQLSSVARQSLLSARNSRQVRECSSVAGITMWYDVFATEMCFDQCFDNTNIGRACVTWCR